MLFIVHSHQQQYPDMYIYLFHLLIGTLVYTHRCKVLRISHYCSPTTGELSRDTIWAHRHSQVRPKGR